jgi:hypothetical protein
VAPVVITAVPERCRSLRLMCKGKVFCGRDYHASRHPVQPIASWGSTEHPRTISKHLVDAASGSDARLLWTQSCCFAAPSRSTSMALPPVRSHDSWNIGNTCRISLARTALSKKPAQSRFAREEGRRNDPRIIGGGWPDVPCKC